MTKYYELRRYCLALSLIFLSFMALHAQSYMDMRRQQMAKSSNTGRRPRPVAPKVVVVTKYVERPSMKFHTLDTKVSEGSTQSLDDGSLSYTTYNYYNEISSEKHVSNILLEVDFPTSGNEKLKTSIINWIRNELSGQAGNYLWNGDFIMAKIGSEVTDGNSMLTARAENYISIAKSQMSQEGKNAADIGLGWQIKLIDDGPDFVTYQSNMTFYKSSYGSSNEAFHVRVFRKSDGQIFDNNSIFSNKSDNLSSLRRILRSHFCENNPGILSQDSIRINSTYATMSATYNLDQELPLPINDIAFGKDGARFRYENGEVASDNNPMPGVNISYNDLLPYMNVEARAMVCDRLGTIDVGNFSYDVGDGKAIVSLAFTSVEGDVEIPEDIQYGQWSYKVCGIGNKVFLGRDAITSITFPKTITALPEGAFVGCRGLKSITLPPKLTEVPDQCFLRCISLEEVNIPDRVTRIGASCFTGCESLKNITLPASLEELGDTCFGKTALTEIALPNHLKRIGSHCFFGCKALSKASLPASLQKIGSSAFWNCGELSGSLRIADDVEELGDATFYGCKKLQSITLGSGLTRIGDDCFRSCTLLDSITIPAKVTYIGARAFAECQNMTSLKLNGKVETLGERCFFDCKGITSVTLPATLSEIGDKCFKQCMALQEVTCLWQSPKQTKMGIEVFYNIHPEAVLFLPKGAKKYFKDVTNFIKFDKIKKIKDEELFTIRPTDED